MIKKPLVYEGKRFGNLVVIKEIYQARDKNGRLSHKKYLCKCDCGKESTPWGSSLTSGVTVSCGCHKRKAIKEACTKHGMVNTPTYSSWSSMIQRCTNPKAPGFNKYGGAGITVCDEWFLFENFFKDMGVRGDNTSLDRIDGSKGYSKDNCRWADIHVQNLNTRKRNNCSSIYKGVAKHKSGWLCRAFDRHIGVFKTEIEAAKAYNEYVKNHEGCVLNPIDERI